MPSPEFTATAIQNLIEEVHARLRARLEGRIHGRSTRSGAATPAATAAPAAGQTPPRPASSRSWAAASGWCIPAGCSTSLPPNSCWPNSRRSGLCGMDAVRWMLWDGCC